MKKHLMMVVALFVAVALASPALAAVEMKYGGQFRTRATSNYGLATDGEWGDRNANFIDTRLRMYFYFVASENLRVVTRFEVGDTRWGNPGGRVGPSSGGGVGADGVNVETKSAFVEFGIPNTPVVASVGIQGLYLLDSWIIDDDFSAAVLRAKFDPIGVQLGYIAAQNLNVSDENANIDSFFLSLDYNGNVGPGALYANLVGYFQDGHSTLVSADPNTLRTPARAIEANTIYSPVFDLLAGGAAVSVDKNYLFDLGLKLGYKMDWMSAYFNFVKNFGSVDFNDNGSVDYTGWMIDGGASFFYGPYTFNIGGFYTTGQDLREIERTGELGDIDQFTYPLATSKYFSEIIGGGVFDNDAIGHRGPDGGLTGAWRGYGFPTNIWTVTVGGAWQALEKTKVAASYWYFATSEKVPGYNSFREIEGIKWENEIGHELNLNITQGIVDGLNLDIVGAYLFTGDAYSMEPSGDDNVYEVGARLQWNF